MKNKRANTEEQIWNTIAESYDSTRRKPWNQCLDFIDELSSQAIVADLGCGNGRHLLPCAEHCKTAIGVDISQKLLQISKQKTKERNLQNVLFIHGDVRNIPLKDSSIDALLYIASLHSIKGRNERIRSLQEVSRILKQNGTALISVWSRWQDKYRNYFIKQFFTRNRLMEFGDIDIFWRQHGLNIPRFYHLYSKREFLEDISQSGLKIKKMQSVKFYSRYTVDNYFALVQKQ